MTIHYAFVTGAGGFIGRHLVAELLARQVRVTALMLNNEAVPPAWGDKVRVVRGDIRKLATLADEIGYFDTLYHLAAIVSDWGGRQEHVDITVHGTEQAIQLSLRNKARFVVTTSVAAYGDKLGSGVIDETVARGTTSSNYEYVKQLQEDVTLHAVRQYGLHATIIRPANVYGVGSVWVERFVEKLANKQPALMGDGHWDAGLVHVRHVVEGMILAAESKTLPSGEVFILADDPGITWHMYMNALSATLGLPRARSIPNWLARMLAPVLEKFGQLVGQKTPPVVTNLAYRLLGVRSVFLNEKAKRLLGFQPTVSLEEAMAEIKQNFDSRG